MSAEQKKRCWNVIKLLLQVLLIGLAYYIFIQITGWAIPCPIKLITGKFCPGCGISRMLLALLQLDFETAYHANRLLFFLLPVILIYALIKAVQYIKTGKESQSRPEMIITVMVCLVTIAFWIMRNTEAFAFLAPMG